MGLAVRHDSFACCGSSSVSGFYMDKYQVQKNRQQALLQVENDINIINKKNLAIAVLIPQQLAYWREDMEARGWRRIGDGVINSKTKNELQIWILDFTKRVIETPKSPPPVNGFNADGVRLDRRDEPRTFYVGPRSTVNEYNEVKEYFSDANGHRVLFVDLPVFNRGQLHDRELNFYSIRLANGGGSYSWLQGGTHRFPNARVRDNQDLVGGGLDDDDDDL